MTDSHPEIDKIRARFHEAMALVATAADLKAVRDRFLGRTKGELNFALKQISFQPPATRPAFGAAANALKHEIDQTLELRELELLAAAPIAGSVDITLPGRIPSVGRRHPLTQVRERIEDIFAAMGYQIIEGPEIEDDWHNFEALNMPPEHPARDMQDTLYLATPVPPSPSAGQARPGTLLRTHTSGMQIRYMESHAPPVRIIAPGRVYRRDNFDATHTPMFTQVEGLVVDENISLGDLKGTLNSFAERFFDAKVKTRFRPSFFPYTEPSAELDVECQGCHGRGCPLCKQTGWLEILGCGMVHPAVFEAVGYDAGKYTGFAFGMGIERVALRLYGIDDIRMLFENDLRFLEQLAP
ncbi:MAG: phenylalanine--tRNA ligase subunit alpha [Vicinamibacterales bacterium]